MADYYAQSSIYHPDPYQTTVLPKRFPKHHYPMEHTRHSVGHALKDVHHGFNDFRIAEQATINPRVDAHETKSTFYIDVELPGVQSQERMTLKWLSTRTLLFGAVVSRPLIPIDESGPTQSTGPDSASAKTEVVYNHIESEKSGLHSSEGNRSVYMTIGERRIGKYGRAFRFPVDVDRDRASVNLDAGLLRITVPKLGDTVQGDKNVCLHIGERLPSD